MDLLNYSHLPYTYIYIYMYVGGERPAPTDDDLAVGDQVKVTLDPDVWKRMQQGHGEWNDLMAEVNQLYNVDLCMCDRD